MASHEALTYEATLRLEAQNAAILQELRTLNKTLARLMGEEPSKEEKPKKAAPKK